MCLTKPREDSGQFENAWNNTDALHSKHSPSYLAPQSQLPYQGPPIGPPRISQWISQYPMHSSASRGWNVTYDIKPPISGSPYQTPHIKPPISGPPYQAPHKKPSISDPHIKPPILDPYCKPPTISSPPYQALHFNMKPLTYHIKPLVFDVQNEPTI